MRQNRVSPTRLEGMETINELKIVRAEIGSPTRLEGMETNAYVTQRRGKLKVSDPP